MFVPGFKEAQMVNITRGTEIIEKMTYSTEICKATLCNYTVPEC